MVRRESERSRVFGQILQPDRLGVVDQQAEDAVALGVRADRGDLLVGDTAGDEPDQPFAVVTDDTEGAVPGPGEFRRR